jgi:hypothetical protein
LHLDGGIRLRVLHELSTEASRDGAIDLLFLRLRLPVTKNESFRIFQNKNMQRNSGGKRKGAWIRSYPSAGRTVTRLPISPRGGRRFMASAARAGTALLFPRAGTAPDHRTRETGDIRMARDVHRKNLYRKQIYSSILPLD